MALHSHIEKALNPSNPCRCSTKTRRDSEKCRRWVKHLTRCGKPGCRCASDPAAQHGPYYDWGHMHRGRLVHRRLSAEQAALLRPAIANYRKIKKLLRAWEVETERLIEAEAPRDR